MLWVKLTGYIDNANKTQNSPEVITLSGENKYGKGNSDKILALNKIQ
jgi:hypothetical protein